ncbi:late competence protein ComGG [Streptococcus agalactiae]|nr:hypothetical protein CHF17_00286 [Streptococcus agalactiae]EJS81878.1 hypothetical protein GB112_06244 [Streptococcus agalactiae GB00112]KXA54266.1 hypothetical protein HMPREF1884_01197 [Streptococcus agalactiae]CFQ26435.1 late competence protein ComGG [Streptococcus agalactiae]CFR28896.1 late competence protein ComGG [Streptococcus agalactiae]
MILKKKLKAGILLQAIVLAAVFTLVLQFYLARILATERQYHRIREETITISFIVK